MDGEIELSTAGSEVSAEAQSLARKLMSAHPECFWFWDQQAPLATADDLRLVIRQLREYGDKSAWLDAAKLARCL